MPANIRFPATPEFAAERAIMRLLPQRVPAEKETAALARRFKMKGTVVDEGPLFAVKTEDAILHHFHASDSMRWALVAKRGRSHPAEALDTRDEAELRSTAEKFLAKLGLLDEQASFASITYGERATITAKAREPASVITRAYVNFAYTFEALPVAGPGAKAQVEIGPGGTVVGCYRFWRRVEGSVGQKAVARPVVSWDAAQKLFRRDPAFAQLEASADIVVDRARLAYMAMPPRDVQGVLFPVYEMHGRVSTPQIERAPFRRYVVAIDYKLEDLKTYGVANRHFRGNCQVL